MVDYVLFVKYARNQNRTVTSPAFNRVEPHHTGAAVFTVQPVNENYAIISYTSGDTTMYRCASLIANERGIGCLYKGDLHASFSDAMLAMPEVMAIDKGIDLPEVEDPDEEPVVAGEIAT